eukprot:COSAG02_NODE_40638_length_403_cov_0.753289_1_plen_88_part_01
MLHTGTIAAEQEDPDASYRLAYMHKVGRGGLPQDDATAAALETVSAKQVFPPVPACCTLSTLGNFIAMSVGIAVAAHNLTAAATVLRC